MNKLESTLARSDILLHIDDKVQALKDEVISIRRHLHRIPEKGLNEHETTGYIYEYLRDMGIKAEIGPSGTGVIAYIEGKPGSKAIAFRADIDALSIEEQTGVEYCSKNEGFMHACGHDGHTAVLLGFARLLVNMGNALDNNVLLVFQPAEEGPGGAEIIVKNGALEQYDASCIFGLHIFPDIEEGKIGCRPGALMAQTGEFDLYIEGKSCHGAMPHKGNDALVAASNVILALNTIVGRFTDPLEPAVVTVGKMVSGERMNVIAGEALLQGTMRAFNDTTYNTLKDRVIKMADSISGAYGCSCRYEYVICIPLLHNDESLLQAPCGDIGDEDFCIYESDMLGRGFFILSERIPGLFLCCGRQQGKGYIHPRDKQHVQFQ